MTALEAAAFRGVQAREQLQRVEAARIRADLDAAVAHLAARMGLDPARHGSDFRVDVDAGVVLVRGSCDADDQPSG